MENSVKINPIPVLVIKDISLYFEKLIDKILFSFRRQNYIIFENIRLVFILEFKIYTMTKRLRLF